MAGHQLRLLLWKDYLIRRRKWVTLAGVVWAVAVVFSLYIVRINVDNQDFPTCQFAARALPSAGLLTFLQSFVCSVNNECLPMDKYQEIPTYDNSKLTQLQRQFSPLIYNETVLDVAASVPNALKLLSTLADVVDQPTFVDITKNGLRFQDLFRNPRRLKRVLVSNINIEEDVATSVLMAELNFEGLFKRNTDKCNTQSVTSILHINNKEHADTFATKICSLSSNEVIQVVMTLLGEVDFHKFSEMIGDIYHKLSGDRRLLELGDMVTAVLHMARFESFLPSELVNIFTDKDVDFNYFDMTVIQRLMDIYEPTFGDTDIYKSIRVITDAFVVGIQYINKVTNNTNENKGNTTEERHGTETKDVALALQPTKVLNKAIKVLEASIDKEKSSINIFHITAQLTKVIYKFLSQEKKHDLLFYSTLISKLIEGAIKVIKVNTHIQEMAYNVSLRNPEGIKILVGLPPHVIGKGFEALANAERTQILTAKIDFPGQMFCDSNRIQGFFKISKADADSLKSQFCTNPWKIYVTDLIRSFGIYDVKNNINTMASIVIQDTIGKDVTDQLYSIDKIFDVLKNFTHSLTKMNAEDKQKLNWNKLFNISDDSEFMNVVREKGYLGKQMLIVAHGALAKEVVKQNPLLEYKISPTLIDITTVVAAINEQLGTPSADLVKRFKDLYPDVIRTMLQTILNEDKTYSTLSTLAEDIVCNGTENALTYLEFPPDIDLEVLLNVLCDAAVEIEKGLQRGSVMAKALTSVKNSTHFFESVDWTKLINNIKSLYLKLDEEYPYLFEYKSYGMDKDTQDRVNTMLKDAEEFWFSVGNMERGARLSIKLVLRFLDLVDRDIFDITDQTWLKTKQIFASATKSLGILNDAITDITGFWKNETVLNKLPHSTSLALSAIIPNIPNLIVDFANVILNEDTDIAPIISLMNADPPWPCSATSISEYVKISGNSSVAVKGIETLICMDSGLQQEWVEYLDEWTSNVSTSHVFLKFSSVLDFLIDDTTIIRDAFNDIFNDVNTDGRHLTIITAWRYVMDVFNSTDQNATFSQFFSKVDTILNAVNTSGYNQSTNIIWEQYIKCSNGSIIDGECKMLGRTAWKYTFEFLSVMLENLATDLTTYLTEANEPNSNILQLLGFTRSTGLYILYEKFPEFVGALINSYWDYGFMSQIRRATTTQFWDCNAVVDALLPLPGSGINSTVIDKVRPFVCPSILHWISLPRGDNTLLDLVSKPQYLFYTLPVQNLSSRYEEVFNRITKLSNLLTDIAKKNKTVINEDDLKVNSIQVKLKDTVDAILNYTMDKTDATYRLFNEINMKQFYGTIYLTRVVAAIDKLSIALHNVSIAEIKGEYTEEEMKKLGIELSAIQKMFKRRPTDVVALHFDIITDLVWMNDDNYKLTSAVNAVCTDLRNNDTSKNILNEDERTKLQICNKNHKLIYGAVENSVMESYNDVRNSLLNLVNVLQKDSSEEITNIFQFLRDRKQLVKSLKYSIKYARDLGLPIYLKYLHSNLQNYNVVLSFLAGEDWWTELRSLYSGPYASGFFDVVEKSLDIAEDVMSKPDSIHIVRLLRDINLNNTEAICQPNITISDYIPDATGAISALKQQVCTADRTDIFKEIPPLLFASQGYNDDLKLSKDVNHTAINTDILTTESKLSQLTDGPRTPQRPKWIDDEKLISLRKVALGIFSKESVTKVSFGLLSNSIDAGTLFLNSSHCILCSEFTTWFKQINLQLFKKQEYDNLLCHMHTMSLEDIYLTLKNDFHWDMAFKELISSRNYTKYEMNKAITELLEQVKLHLLEDISANSTKLAQCLTRNVISNELGNATLFITVFSHTAKLIRSQLPHLHEVNGITEVSYFKRLQSEVAHKLDVQVPLKNYLVERNTLYEDLEAVVNEDIVRDINEAKVNLRMIKSSTNKPLQEYIYLKSHSWADLCQSYDCEDISILIDKNINRTLVKKELEDLQSQEFWRFNFISNIIQHAEELVSHVGRLLGIASNLDLPGVLQGRLASIINLMMQILMDDTLSGIVYSIQGMLKEMSPLLQDTALENDLRSITRGLIILQEIKTYLVEKQDLKVDMAKVFLNGDRVESSFGKLGINNTNFWSVAAPRIHSGYIHLKPLLSSKQSDYHIADFVCQPDQLSTVLTPGDLGLVTADDVYGAVVEQFCTISDDQAKQIIPILFDTLNYSYIFDKVSETILSQLYAASNLTQSDGSTVLENLPQMAALLPTIQNSVGDLSETLISEPLFQTLKEFDTVGGLLSSSAFLSSAGNMLCGKPFQTDLSRFYKVITQTKDMSTKPDQAHLDALPTDFCRSLYKDILNIDGGKIVWSFVKPLIMGKILYTPNTPTVQRIIEKANGTFSHMIKLTGLVHSFARAFSSIDKLSEHRAGLAVMKRLLTSSAFQEIRLSLMGDHQLPDFDVDSLFDEFGDLKDVGRLLTKASDLLQCINLNRFKAARDEHDLTHQAVQLSFVNEFSAGLVFLNSEDQGTPTNIEYKIRMDIENAPTTKRLKNYMWIPGPEASFIENMRYFRGFIQIQDIIDKAIIDLSRRRYKRDLAEDQKWSVYTQQMPYPCYRKDFFQTSLYESQALLVALFFSLLFTVASTVRFIVIDKESGNTLLMSVMGVNLCYHTLSWFLASFTEMTVTCAGVTLVFWLGGVLPNTPPLLIFTLLIIFGFSVICFCYLMSKLYTSASFAAVSTAIAYLITFMPIVMVLSLESVLSRSYKMLICLSMSSAVSYAFVYIARYEAMGMGANWSDLWSSPVEEGLDMNIGTAAAMMIVDSIIYVIIGWLIDRFFGPKTLRRNITNCVTSGEKAGVSIVNITKIYGERSRRPKVALDNVSIELQKGQITTLLGHNGAGKTTLTKILMGMLKPTKGHIIIRSEHETGTTLGICPQNDILFEYMNAREHVALYAQLKSGLPLDQVRDEVEKVLSALSLGAAGGVAARQLSGGTRRRLCVALAFVARPRLVALDEPTAGVDPAARRDIWSMIMKLKEDRTILLTTHHLDEAELLSDQVVIMHKGQVHTTGSPIEIKRTLGTGYKLTVTYPNQPAWSDAKWKDEQFYIEEKTKELLTAVKEVVTNASLVDVNGTEVEITIPFYDPHGLNTNFLQLCTVLESKQTTLGYKTYSMECSTLEQVFFNICQQVDTPQQGIEYGTGSEDTPSKSASSSSIKNDSTPLVDSKGPLRGTPGQQFLALIHARYLHYSRNRWLLFLLVVLPSLFMTIAMAFSTIRPPADNEIALQLRPALYENATDFLIAKPSVYAENMNPAFAAQVMELLALNKHTRSWKEQDSPTCKCTDTRQECDRTNSTTYKSRPEMMLLPDVDKLNHWLVSSQENYIEKRYGGYSSAVKNNISNLVVWYNNKGHHALPSYLNGLNTAILRTVADDTANITTYSHPLKISKEQISKDTVYQHVADAGISALVLVAFSLVSAGGAEYLVAARCSQQKRLQLLSGVSPAVYWAAALAWDMLIIIINMLISVVLMEAFHFPVFVARDNLPAICLLLLLYGYACSSLVHLAEKLFTEPSLANMMLFCGNTFMGLVGIAILLIMDVISESDETDNARWVLHKVFMVSPQFALGDGLLEIAKNTIQAQVLDRFGMDTYRSPFGSDLVVFHYTYLVIVGTALLLLNLAIEYDYVDNILTAVKNRWWWCSRGDDEETVDQQLEAADVCAERRRVHATLPLASPPLTIRTIGNINAGFVDSEDDPKKKSYKRISSAGDVAACVELSKSYPTLGGNRRAVHRLTLAIPAGQCTALLGQNGAGKSTTFAMLTGQLQPTSGRVHLQQRPATRRDLCQGLISYCPQSDAIDPLLTVEETLAFYCRLRGITEIDEVCGRAACRLSLAPHARTRGAALSGGNKRKLCAALALAARAPLVLLDEPTSGMDPASRGRVWRAVAAGGARGVVLSTHALDDARRLATRVALMRSGRLVALDTLNSCLQRFGGGYIVRCVCGGGGGGAGGKGGEHARDVWRRVRATAPHAALRLLHRAALHFLVPARAAVDKKEIVTQLSDIFRLMAELQGSCDIEDYTINQSSLDQMFLSFTDKADIDMETVDLEPLPTHQDLRQTSEDLDTVTSL